MEQQSGFRSGFILLCQISDVKNYNKPKQNFLVHRPPPVAASGAANNSFSLQRSEKRSALLTLARNQHKGGEPLLTPAHSGKSQQDTFLTTPSLAGFNSLKKKNERKKKTFVFCLNMYSPWGLKICKICPGSRHYCIFFFIFRSDEGTYSIEFCFPHLCLLSSKHTPNRNLLKRLFFNLLPLLVVSIRSPVFTGRVDIMCSLGLNTV